jgi:hypothetical protein
MGQSRLQLYRCPNHGVIEFRSDRVEGCPIFDEAVDGDVCGEALDGPLVTWLGPTA